MFSPTQELPKYSADAIELGEVYLKSEGEALGATNREPQVAAPDGVSRFKGKNSVSTESFFFNESGGRGPTASSEKRSQRLLPPLSVRRGEFRQWVEANSDYLLLQLNIFLDDALSSGIASQQSRGLDSQFASGNYSQNYSSIHTFVPDLYSLPEGELTYYGGRSNAIKSSVLERDVSSSKERLRLCYQPPPGWSDIIMSKWQEEMAVHKSNMSDGDPFDTRSICSVPLGAGIQDDTSAGGGAATATGEENRNGSILSGRDVDMKGKEYSGRKESVGASITSPKSELAPSISSPTSTLTGASNNTLGAGTINNSNNAVPVFVSPSAEDFSLFVLIGLLKAVASSLFGARLSMVAYEKKERFYDPTFGATVASMAAQAATASDKTPFSLVYFDFIVEMDGMVISELPTPQVVARKTLTAAATAGGDVGKNGNEAAAVGVNVSGRKAEEESLSIKGPEVVSAAGEVPVSNQQLQVEVQQKVVENTHDDAPRENVAASSAVLSSSVATLNPSQFAHYVVVDRNLSVVDIDERLKLYMPDFKVSRRLHEFSTVVRPISFNTWDWDMLMQHSSLSLSIICLSRCTDDVERRVSMDTYAQRGANNSSEFFKIIRFRARVRKDIHSTVGNPNHPDMKTTATIDLQPDFESLEDFRANANLHTVANIPRSARTSSHNSEHRVNLENLLLRDQLAFERMQNEDLRRELAAARQSLEMKRMFVRYVSHEIRTPLNTVSMGLKLMQDGRKYNTPGSSSAHRRSGSMSASAKLLLRRDSSALDSLREVDEEKEERESVVSVDTTVSKPENMADDLKESCNIAIDILNDLLLYEKLEGGLLQLDKREEPAFRTIVEAVKSFVIQAKQAKVDLQFTFNEKDIPSDDLEGDSPSLFFTVDKPKICQVLRNLISNAIKFSPENSIVSIHLTVIEETNDGVVSRRRRRKSASEQKRRLMRIAVTDSGPGISLENQKKLFNSIVQFDANKLQAGGGSGLGLFISKSIMDMHGGHIGVFSEGEGTGSSFYLDLPIFCHGPEPTSTAPSSPRTHGARERESAASDPTPTGTLDTSMVPASASGGDVVRGVGRSSNIIRSGASTRIGSSTTTPEYIRAVNLKAAARLGSFRLVPDKGLSIIQSQRASLLLTNDVFAGSMPYSSPTVPTSYKILIVDDSRTNRRMVRKLLLSRRACTQFEDASDGKEALELVRASLNPPALAGTAQSAPFPMNESMMSESDKVPHYYAILMDYVMPVMDGPTATKAIRAAGYKGLIVGITGNVQDEEVNHFLSSGADLVMGKPLDTEKLVDLLGKASEHLVREKKQMDALLAASSKEQSEKCPEEATSGKGTPHSSAQIASAISAAVSAVQSVKCTPQATTQEEKEKLLSPVPAAEWVLRSDEVSARAEDKSPGAAEEKQSIQLASLRDRSAAIISGGFDGDGNAQKEYHPALLAEKILSEEASRIASPVNDLPNPSSVAEVPEKSQMPLPEETAASAAVAANSPASRGDNIAINTKSSVVARLTELKAITDEEAARLLAQSVVEEVREKMRREINPDAQIDDVSGGNDGGFSTSVQRRSQGSSARPRGIQERNQKQENSLSCCDLFTNMFNILRGNKKLKNKVSDASSVSGTKVFGPKTGGTQGTTGAGQVVSGRTGTRMAASSGKRNAHAQPEDLDQLGGVDQLGGTTPRSGPRSAAAFALSDRNAAVSSSRAPPAETPPGVLRSSQQGRQSFQPVCPEDYLLPGREMFLGQGQGGPDLSPVTGTAGAAGAAGGGGECSGTDSNPTTPAPMMFAFLRFGLWFRRSRKIGTTTGTMKAFVPPSGERDDNGGGGAGAAGGGGRKRRKKRRGARRGMSSGDIFRSSIVSRLRNASSSIQQGIRF